MKQKTFSFSFFFSVSLFVISFITPNFLFAQVVKPGAPTNATTTTVWNADSQKVSCEVNFSTRGGLGQIPTEITISVYEAWLGNQGDTIVAYSSIASLSTIGIHSISKAITMTEPKLFMGSGDLFKFKILVANDAGYLQKEFFNRSPLNETVGINETQNNLVLQIQNPVGRQCNFVTNIIFDEIVVVDASGKIAQKNTNIVTSREGDYSIPAEMLPRGVYFLSLVNKGVRLVTKRILKD